MKIINLSSILETMSLMIWISKRLYLKLMEIIINKLSIKYFNSRISFDWKIKINLKKK